MVAAQIGVAYITKVQWLRNGGFLGRNGPIFVTVVHWYA